MPSTIARSREIAEILRRNGLDMVVAASGLASRKGASPLLKLLASKQVIDEGLTQPAIIRRTLEELGPTFIKMGQLLSTRQDLISPELVVELRRLQNRTIPVPVADIRQVIVEELGHPIEELFATFNDKPMASASLGQTHTATLHDGSEVVVKVQRPDIDAVIEADLAIARRMASQLSRVWDVAAQINIEGFVDEFDRQLHQEMDYLREGRNAERIAANFARRSGLRVPTIHWTHTTKRVLTMERLYGLRVDNNAALDEAGIDRRALGRRASRIILDMVMVDGFFHADPHPGNLLIQPNGDVGLVDFGMVGRLNERVRRQLTAIIVAFAAKDSAKLAESTLVFAPPRGQVDRIRLVREVEQLMDLYVDVPLAQVNAGQLVNKLFELMRANHLQPPTEVSLVGRMLALLDGFGRSLDPDYNMMDVLRPYVERLLRKRLRPERITEEIASFLTEGADLGLHAPARLARILQHYEFEGVRVAIDAETVEPYMRRIEALGDRLVAGFLLGSAVAAVGNLGATDKRFLARLRAPLLAIGVSGAGMLAGYLLKSSTARLRR